MKAIVLGSSSILYFIFSPGSLHYGNVYRHESGRCHTLPFFYHFLSFHLSRFSFYTNLHLLEFSVSVPCAPLSMLFSPRGTLGPSSVDNGADGTEKVLLKTQESEDFVY